MGNLVSDRAGQSDVEVGRGAAKNTKFFFCLT